MPNTIGVDVGSTSTKIVLLKQGEIHYKIRPTGWSPRDAAHQILEELLQEQALSREEIDFIVATGYGRVAITYAHKAVTEITCHGRGAAFLVPETDTIIDIGGQDSKVIKITPQGKVMDFMMNDKCAAGTGRFLGVMAAALGLDVDDLGKFQDVKPASITNMCTVFAESEVIGLLAQGTPKDAIISGLHQAIARRVAAMVKKRGSYEKVVFTGGVALNQGVCRSLEKELGTKILVPEYCQIAGAIGAALIGQDSCPAQS
ncbi:acyl-CoA dehydratase activase [Dehalobacterium formicoaceticum]|uniref:Acyl-CoA dehydratase activase n=1 Tax=Dehalobacterium formicoaceticum TaxID=51515 RepID=A0ABT1Y2U4_9FIRM|nr:acyl-CoA dehydratase activase [Dehalobacterium formicoaceticum]MCR6545193.1 acyl-CoA dehydratase activase [Dehalobacterium formicoaceticum]